MSAFSRDDLAGFVDEHYGPDQMILSAAGAVDHDRSGRAGRSAVRRPDAPRRAMWPTPRALPAAKARRSRRWNRRISRWPSRAPGYRDDAIYTAQIYSPALGGGMSSRLFQEIREKRGLCYTIFAQTGAYDDTGMTTIYAGTSGDADGRTGGHHHRRDETRRRRT